MPNILLVDDEERFVKSLHIILNHYNYQCTEATSGREAIRLLGEKCFDLALLDVDLPDVSGYEILEYIKKSCIHTTAVMLTGMSTVETAVMAMKHGAYDFLNKPIHHELLLKTIAKALQHNELSKKLEASEARFQVLAEASWEGLVIHEGGRLIEANDQFFSMFGYGPDELREGIFLDKILSPASLPFVNQRIELGLLGDYEAIGVRKDKKVFPIEAKTRNINYLGSAARVCSIRDLSERLRAEEEKFELHRKLEKANKIKSLGLMAGAVAHDLNNILSGVVSYPDLLLAQMNESDRFYLHIKKIQEAGKRAASVVRDLVALTRGSSLPKTVENINSLILNYLDSIEHNERLAHYPDVLIQTNLQKNIHNVCCAPLQIHKVLLNLIGNALEAVKRDGRIRITTQNCKFINPLSMDTASGGSEDYVKMSIADNGPGILQKDMDHIFDPFYSTKIMGKSGTGLGLSIVWNTVQENNGWVEVRNEDAGALFEVYLPATTEDACSAPQELDYWSLRGKGETVLLIDDQVEQNETIGGLLSRLNYKTHAVQSGEEGVAFLKSQAVDLVLLDMMMGDGLNGHETFERILQINPHQKAILISGYSKYEDLLQAKNIGVTKFLEKPVTMSQLGHAIKMTLHCD